MLTIVITGWMNTKLLTNKSIWNKERCKNNFLLGPEVNFQILKNVVFFFNNRKILFSFYFDTFPNKLIQF